MAVQLGNEHRHLYRRAAALQRAWTPGLPDQLRDFAKLLGLSKRLKLLQRPVLDLADPLARDVEGPPDLGA